jgi:DNA-3-methyladenine glycosylase
VAEAVGGAGEASRGAFGAAMLPRAFYERDSRQVAPQLLGKLLVRPPCAARIVEVEAYCGAQDPASHAYRGRTARNATMFGPAGLLYVYFSYGVHWCANVVCGKEGEAMAVLLRAAAPVAGLEEMRRRRLRARADPDLCSGPGKLCQAFGIGRRHDGADLAIPRAEIWMAYDGTDPPRRPGRGPRVGISAAAERRWRWWVPGDPNVSRFSRVSRVSHSPPRRG